MTFLYPMMDSIMVIKSSDYSRNTEMTVAFTREVPGLFQSRKCCVCSPAVDGRGDLCNNDPIQGFVRRPL